MVCTVHYHLEMNNSAQIKDCISTSNPVDYHHNIYTVYSVHAVTQMYMLRNQRSLSFRRDSLIPNSNLFVDFRLLTMFMLQKSAKVEKKSTNGTNELFDRRLLTNNNNCLLQFPCPSRASPFHPLHPFKPFLYLTHTKNQCQLNSTKL